MVLLGNDYLRMFTSCRWNYSIDSCNSEMNSDVDEANKFYNELHNVVKRWMDEGDALTTFEIVGALEAVKSDVMESLVRRNRNGRDY